MTVLEKESHTKLVTKLSPGFQVLCSALYTMSLTEFLLYGSLATPIFQTRKLTYSLTKE